MLIEHLSLWFPNNGSKWVLQLTDCELPWIRAFKPSCKGVVVFSCVCSWFEGRSAQSWTCELFPQTFPAELWSFRAVVSATCLGCAGAAVFYYCSTLEMEAKKCLKIPNRCYCLLNPKALDSYRLSVVPSCASQASIFSCSNSVTVQNKSKIILFCTSNLDFNPIKHM